MRSFDFEDMGAFRPSEHSAMKKARLDTQTRVVKLTRAEKCYLIEKREVWIASEDELLVRRLCEAYERRTQNDR